MTREGLDWHLQQALARIEDPDTAYHVRQALQLLQTVETREDLLEDLGEA